MAAPTDTAKNIELMPNASTSLPPIAGPITKAEAMTAFWTPKKEARLSALSSVASATQAEAPASELDSPAPSNNRAKTSKGSVGASPVPTSATAQSTMPLTIRIRRPAVSAKRPIGRFSANFAMLGEETNSPTELCERPNFCPNRGKIGMSAPTATKTGNCEARNTCKSLSLSAVMSFCMPSLCLCPTDLRTDDCLPHKQAVQRQDL
mmetsp:Transcript_134961/g.269327  ORF Transcript_134961/g.269327 Transcript_134961/m.269327 type:complete len:207 (+) Transcript_134961:905-1525(+)